MPVRWTAPEALDSRKFSTKSDVWSYGVLLYEIWTKAEMPFKGMTNQKVWVSVAAGYRLPIPEDCPQTVYGLMLHCWRADPHERPEFSHVSAFFREPENTKPAVRPREDASKSNCEQPGVEMRNAYIDVERKDGTICRASQDLTCLDKKRNTYVALESQDGNLVRASQEFTKQASRAAFDQQNNHAQQPRASRFQVQPLKLPEEDEDRYVDTETPKQSKKDSREYCEPKQSKKDSREYCEPAPAAAAAAKRESAPHDYCDANVRPGDYMDPVVSGKGGVGRAGYSDPVPHPPSSGRAMASDYIEPNSLKMVEQKPLSASASASASHAYSSMDYEAMNPAPQASSKRLAPNPPKSPSSPRPLSSRHSSLFITREEEEQEVVEEAI